LRLRGPTEEIAEARSRLKLDHFLHRYKIHLLKKSNPMTFIKLHM
jgi:hypothetical protein